MKKFFCLFKLNKLNERFRRAFEEFLNRRRQFLFVFASEVRNLIKLQIQELEKQQAEKHASGWGATAKLSEVSLEQKNKLLQNKTQLDAYSTAEDTDAEGSIQFQVSNFQEKFVARATELSQIKQAFTENKGIIECVIVGGAGLGKSRLANQYVFQNQKKYSEIQWWNAERSDFIIDQIQAYLETCRNAKFDLQEKDIKTALIKRFFQTLGKENDGSPRKNPKKACIIFDNADSIDQISAYLPDKNIFPTLQIDILFTSRYKTWSAAAIIELQAFGLEDVKEYVSKNIPNTEVDPSINRVSEELHKLTGGLPLALSLAVAYIKRKEMSISDFVLSLRMKTTKSLSFFNLE